VYVEECRQRGSCQCAVGAGALDRYWHQAGVLVVADAAVSVSFFCNFCMIICSCARQCDRALQLFEQASAAQSSSMTSSLAVWRVKDLQTALAVLKGSNIYRFVDFGSVGFAAAVGRMMIAMMG